MTDPMPTTRFRFWLWLIGLVGVIVPRRLRADWRQEWEAELRHRETMLAGWAKLNWRTRLDLLWRSLGAFCDRIVADDWVITLTSGKVVEGAKADEMSDLVPLDSSYVLRNDEVKVRLLGSDVAVASRLVTDKGRYLGRDIDRVSRSTDVLVKRTRRWQVVSTHLTRVAPPQPKA